MYLYFVFFSNSNMWYTLSEKGYLCGYAYFVDNNFLWNFNQHSYFSFDVLWMRLLYFSVRHLLYAYIMLLKGFALVYTSCTLLYFLIIFLLATSWFEPWYCHNKKKLRLGLLDDASVLISLQLIIFVSQTWSVSALVRGRGYGGIGWRV